MPRGDRTGPMGCGPRTGRGMGDCPDDARADAERGWGMAGGGYGPGRGRGRGRGRGFGPGRAWRRGFRAGWRSANDPESAGEEDAGLEVAWLEEKASRLQQGLDAIQARLDELKQRSG